MRFLVENCSNKVMVTPTNPMHMGLPQTNKQTNKQTNSGRISHPVLSHCLCGTECVCTVYLVCLFVWGCPSFTSLASLYSLQRSTEPPRALLVLRRHAGAGGRKGKIEPARCARARHTSRRPRQEQLRAAHLCHTSVDISVAVGTSLLREGGPMCSGRR